MNKKLIRADIASIEAYTPGMGIAEVRRRFGVKDIIKLASNENALGTSPRALAALHKNLKALHRYPQGNCFELRQVLAKKLKIKQANILLGNGSDELIDIILKTIRKPGAQLLTAEETFVEYKICGRINAFDVKTVPLKEFRYDLKGLLAGATKNTRVIFIANPNNPTGTYVNAQETRSFLKSIPEDILVVFDEAYFEYVAERDFPDLIKLIHAKNIVILRTFSKIFGLAGLRIGYMLAGESFIRCAERVRQPFNVNTLAQIAAQAAVGDKVFVKKTRALIAKEKQFLYAAFSKLGIWYKESAVNFIFVRLNEDSQKLSLALLKKGIIIRGMTGARLNHYARITIGTRAENRRLVKALEEVL